MNYVYDIYLNLNNVLYDFFDWDKNDKLIHIKKIPIFKISEESFKKLINNTIVLDEDSIKNIEYKTELWNVNDKIMYSCIFCDSNNAVGIEFDGDGTSIKKSSLYIDEELDIIEMSEALKFSNIDFKILSKSNTLLKTRKEIREEKFISRELKISDNSRLNYIYFECFGKKEKDKNVIIKNLKTIKTKKNLYDILKLTSKANNKML